MAFTYDEVLKLKKVYERKNFLYMFTFTMPAEVNILILMNRMRTLSTNLKDISQS